MLRVKPSPEVAAILKRIDATKAQIQAAPVPSEEELQRLETAFLEDAACRNGRLTEFERACGLD